MVDYLSNNKSVLSAPMNKLKTVDFQTDLEMYGSDYLMVSDKF